MANAITVCFRIDGETAQGVNAECARLSAENAAPVDKSTVLRGLLARGLAAVRRTNPKE